MSRRIRVLIIDDHPLSRKGISTVISQASGYTVVGEAGSGKEGVSMATQLKPDVAVTDITPREREVLGRHPLAIEIPLILLSRGGLGGR
jgi:chemotaxis response regulator CheB